MMISGISGGMASDSLEVAFDQIVDSLKIVKPNGAEVATTLYNSFFFNGWPKEYYYEEAVDLGLIKQIEAQSIQMIYRHWNIYFRDDESTDNKDI